MTVSGEVTKASVFALPSLRFGKLRLYELMIVFFTDGSMSVRSH